VITAIIPTHNRPQCLLSSLQGLEQLCLHEDLKVIVILDGCNDESWRIATLFQSPNIILIKGDGNLYWGGAIATGMKVAFDELNSSAVIWLNDDSEFEPKDILAVMQAHQIKPKNIIGSNLVARNLNKIPIYNVADHVGDNLYTVSHLNGNCTLIPRIVYERLGNIDANRFPHFADSPYIEKAVYLGFKCLVTKNSEIGIHYDIVRHLPIFLQMLVFRRNYYQFLKVQLFRITSKWFIPYRWNYTLNKFGWKSFIFFPGIFIRDFIPVFLLVPMRIIPFKSREKLVLWIASSMLRLSTIKLQELERELSV
jgi:GT2 family glycosyltransferase